MTGIDMEQFDNSYEAAAEFYFQHAKKLWQANSAFSRRLKDLGREKVALLEELKAYQALAVARTQTESGGHNEEKKRRKRRNASEIQRLYRCKAENCEKSYGSEGTLSQHLKLKHPELYTSYIGDTEERGSPQAREPDTLKPYSREPQPPSKSEAPNP